MVIFKLASTKQGNKIALRHRHAIQHLQQRLTFGVFSIYERKTRVDFCRSVSQSKSRVIGEVSHCTNCTGAIAKQGKLVWHNLVSFRQYQRLGNYCKRMASWCLFKMANCGLVKKLSSPCGGLIDPSISPYYGHIAMVISPCGGLIKGCFDTFLSPCGGHLLDIPLYTALIGDCL